MLNCILFVMLIFIINSCGENPQAVVIDEKPKDTIKTEEKIVLKPADISSININISGIRAKYYHSIYYAKDDPNNSYKEYFEHFNLLSNLNFVDSYIVSSKNDSIVYNQNHTLSPYLIIRKDSLNKNYVLDITYARLSGNNYVTEEMWTSATIKNIKFKQNDSLDLEFNIIGGDIVNYIEKINFVSNTYVTRSNPYSKYSTNKKGLISIVEISDSAKISIRIVKKR